jgi:carboxymethylenebutenolidase
MQTPLYKNINKHIMKYLFFTSLLLLLQWKAFSQQQSCCAISAHDQFVRMSQSIGFQEMHDIPKTLMIDSTKGKTIIYPNTDDIYSNAWLIEAKNKKSKKFVFVLHEWWGLNNFVKNEAIKLHEAMPDVNILCLDLYDGLIAFSRDSAAAYMGRLKTARAETIIKGAIAYVGKKASVYTTGWCLGGGWSLQASLLAGKQAKGCVIYYGMPEQDVNKLKKLKTDVFCVHPTQDKWITQKVMDEFGAKMKIAGKRFMLQQYDADHAFANPSNTTNYKEDFAKDAFAKMVAFFRARM